MAWIELARVHELPTGSLMEVERGDDLIALCNVGGEIRALHGVCPHQGGPLGEGSLQGDLVVCPWHMWEFHSRNGACTFNPDLTIPTYPVRIADGRILVDLA